MEPDLQHINYEYQERQRKKNVKEYQDKFFKNLSKRNNKKKRK